MKAINLKFLGLCPGASYLPLLGRGQIPFFIELGWAKLSISVSRNSLFAQAPWCFLKELGPKKFKKLEQAAMSIFSAFEEKKLFIDISL